MTFETRTSVWQRVRLGLEAVGPLPVVFVLSLVLSYLAILGKITPNADGILYVDAARLLLSDGLTAARQLYDWLFLSALIAGLSSVTGLELQVVAHLLAAVLVALVGVVLVAVTRELYPAATWAAVVVVMALPALNNYRDFIIREHGSWLFTLLSLWLLIRWVTSRRLILVFASQLSLLVATLFRPESLAFLSVPFLWLLFARRPDLSWRDLGPFLILPAVGGVLMLVAAVAFDMQLAAKITKQLQAANLSDQIGAFRDAADRVGAQLSHYVMGTDARRLLFFGLLSLIPIKFLTNLGFCIIPFAYVQGKQGRGEWMQPAGVAPFLWAAGLYAVILAGLVFEIYFMQARFLALLNLFFVPVIALGLFNLWRVAGKWRWLIAALAVISVVDGVYSSSPPKKRYSDAATWLKEQDVDKQRVFYGSPEVAYLVGVVHRIHASNACGTAAVFPGRACWGKFDLYQMVSDKNDTVFVRSIEEQGFSLVREFSDDRGRSVYVFKQLDRHK